MNNTIKGAIVGSLTTLSIAVAVFAIAGKPAPEAAPKAAPEQVVTADAKAATEKVDITYRDIKIVLDKKEVKPQDANGQAVEPFIYNGTTYLPVRAVASALELEVGWDEVNSTVYLGEQLPKVDATDYVSLRVKPDSNFIDNPATNDQASKHPLQYAALYGTGRTTQGDAVKFEKVEFKKEVKKIGIRCGYNLGGDKAGTATEFWVYLDKVEGDPIAKVTVSDKETASSKIVDQVIKYADVKIPAGTHDVFVVGGNENSGSFSEAYFIY